MADFNTPDVSDYRPRFSQIATMMRLPKADVLEGLDLAFVGVPYDMGTIVRPGARQGPAQIREMSRFLRMVNPATHVAPFDLAQVADAGDTPVNALDVEGSHEAIRAYFETVGAAGVVPLVLGGDHTVPLLVLQGLHDADAFSEPPGLLQIDAHADLLVMDDGFRGREINHATFARVALEDGLVDPKRTVQLGLRGSQYAPDTNDLVRTLGGVQIYQHEFDAMGQAAAIAKIVETLGSGPVYITLDIDGMDPTCAPGTGHPEPGGLTVREMQAVFRALRGADVIGCDVCEVSPPHDPEGMTALTAAHLMFEMLCLAAEAVAKRKGR